MVDLEKVRYPRSGNTQTENKYSSSLGPSWQLRLGWQVGVEARLTDTIQKYKKNTKNIAWTNVFDS